MSSKKSICYKEQYESNGFIDHFTNYIVRPPQLLYNEDFLLPKKFPHLTYETKFIPFHLSLYLPTIVDYVVLYLHENCGNRISAFNILPYLPKTYGLATFDFRGCGNRKKNQYITLGYHQSKETKKVIQYLKKRNFKVICWGKSMGAVSLLRQPLDCQLIVVDSAFSDLRTVCLQHIKNNLPCGLFYLGYCFVYCVLEQIRQDIRNKVKVDLLNWNLLQEVQRLPGNVPIIFLCSQNDEIVKPHHTYKLYETYPGFRKNLILNEGKHNDPISKKMARNIFQIIDCQLTKSSKKIQQTVMQSTEQDMKQEQTRQKQLRQFSQICYQGQQHDTNIEFKIEGEIEAQIEEEI